MTKLAKQHRRALRVLLEAIEANAHDATDGSSAAAKNTSHLASAYQQVALMGSPE